MKITKDNVSQVIDFIKSGGSVFVKSDNGSVSDVWQFSLKDDQQVECRNVDTKYAFHYQLTSLEHDAMWGYALVNVSGIPVDMSHYAPQTNRHKHYDLIMQWAADPVSNKVQFKTARNVWMDTADPSWRSDLAYRIKPKEPVIYRQVFFTVASENSHNLSVDKYATFDEFSKDCTHAKPIGWYDATAEERFE